MNDFITEIHQQNNIPFLTNEKLSTFNFNNDDIIKIIRFLNIEKTHGHDDISICMIKICDSAIIKLLCLIFKNCLSAGNFSDVSNVVPIHKKGGKQLLNNYLTNFLLPICGKVFERLIFNAIFKFFDENSLLNSNQSGFWAHDSSES